MPETLPTGIRFQIHPNHSTPDFHSRYVEPDGRLFVINDHHPTVAAGKSACRGRAGTILSWKLSGNIWEGAVGV